MRRAIPEEDSVLDLSGRDVGGGDDNGEKRKELDTGEEDKYAKRPLSVQALLIQVKSLIVSLPSALKNLKSLTISDVFNNQFVFYTAYALAVYFICLSIHYSKLEPVRMKSAVNYASFALVAFAFHGEPPKIHPFVLTLLAAFTSNVLIETAFSSDIVKETQFDTRVCNYFALFLFTPGLFGFRFSKYYVVFMTAVCEIYGVAQYYSDLFRSCPLRPVDFLSIKGALVMREHYSLYQIKGIYLATFAISNLVCVARFALSKNVYQCSRLFRFLAVLISAVLLYTFTFKLDDIYKDQNERGVLQTGYIVRVYRKTGCLYAFYLDYMYYTTPKKPEGYNVREARKILSQFEDKKPKKEHLRKPHIIAILCESFADYGIFSDLKIKEDFMPFMRSMKNNTVKGYVSVSIYGAPTCNSEYEFLTGNSMNFYPYLTPAYVGVVNNRQESLTYILNDYGYNTIALAAIGRTVWNIGSVYDMLKFKEAFFIDEFYDTTKKFGKLPTDRCLFDAIKNIFNNRTKSEGTKGLPLFFYLTTMQNHSPYGKTKRASGYLEGYNIPALNTYLKGIKLTDDAVKDLIAYFSKVKDDVVIVFYGDHYPYLTEFTDKYLGRDLEGLSIEARTKTHMTPFFIWANYPIKSEQANLSLSFLSSKVMEVAGFPRTKYMNFLEDTKKHVPLLTPFTYMDDKGVLHWRENVTDATPYLERWEKVQYYMIHDYKKGE